MKFLTYSTTLLMLATQTLSAQHVFVLAGQSNMAGRGDTSELSAPYDSPQPDVKMWNGSGWSTLAPGNNDHGPELSLGRTLADHYGETIYFVKRAEGAASLAPDPARPDKSWDPATGTLYGELKTRVEDALANLGGGPEVKGFFWMQGEADSKDEAHAGAYLTNFHDLIALAKADFDAPDMAVVLGRVNGTLYPNATFGDKYQFVATVRAAQEQAAATLPSAAWVDTDALALNDDELHFSSAGQIDLGNAMALACLALEAAPPAYRVRRLNGGEPIIDKPMFEAAGIDGDGGNINGPSLIKVPDWIAPADRADPNANYYLYFANHRGNYIRMAWAADIEGPYTLYDADPALPEAERGVLGLPQPADELFLREGEIRLWQEFASPRVFVDEANQRLALYFHTFSGVLRDDGSGTYGSKGQKTHVALSDDGLDFNGNIQPARLGDFYFDIFEYNGSSFAWSNKGYLFEAPAGATLANSGLWTPPGGFDYRDDFWQEFNGPIRANHEADPSEVADNPRHFGTRRVGDTLHVFFTRRDDAPESVLLSKIDLGAGGPADWAATHPPEVVLVPERDWEGTIHPVEASENGSATGVRQLRDPFIYEEDGRIFLLYSGAGEEAIGLAELLPTVESGEGGGTHVEL